MTSRSRRHPVLRLTVVAVAFALTLAWPAHAGNTQGTVKEKGSAWGDIDRDGDLDLVMVARQSTTEDGKAPNKLFISVNGALTERTADFAPDWNVPLKAASDSGGGGDISLVDVNNDGWLDVITTPAPRADGENSGLPWIYINKGCSVGGIAASSCSTDRWRGVLFENDRVPDMLVGGKPAGR